MTASRHQSTLGPGCRPGRAPSVRGTVRALALATLGLALLAPAAARAQADTASYTRSDREIPESPQRFAAELRVARYVPSIDSEFSGATPYRDVFGKSNRYALGFEFDWQAFRIPAVGTLGPGVGVSYTSLTGKSFIASTPGVRGEEETTLTLWPMHAVAVLRVDALSRNTVVPLAFYGKLGAGLALWSVSDGSGTARDGRKVGRGTSYGLQTGLGAMLLLDPLDDGAAREMDSNSGVNNTYLFAEWMRSTLDGFGAGGQMQVGTDTWVIGLALEL